MINSKLFMGFAALSIIGTSIGSSLASANPGRHSVRISGYVPTVCNVKFSAQPVLVTNNTYNFGTMREFCNSASGYRIIAEGGAELSGAVMRVAGVPVVFNTSGNAVLVESANPALVTRNLVLTTNAPISGSVSIRIEAR